MQAPPGRDEHSYVAAIAVKQRGDGHHPETIVAGAGGPALRSAIKANAGSAKHKSFASAVINAGAERARTRSRSFTCENTPAKSREPHSLRNCSSDSKKSKGHAKKSSSTDRSLSTKRECLETSVKNADSASNVPTENKHRLDATSETDGNCDAEAVGSKAAAGLNLPELRRNDGSDAT